MVRATMVRLCGAQARFCILRQKYIEAWEQGDLQMALHTLRSELAPLQINAAEVRMLSGKFLPNCLHSPSAVLYGSHDRQKHFHHNYA